MNAHAAINIITEHYHYHYCFRVDGPKRLKNSTCEHGFFCKRRKKSLFSKNLPYPREGHCCTELVHALTQTAMRKLKQRNYGPTEGEKERKCLSLSHSNL